MAHTDRAARGILLIALLSVVCLAGIPAAGWQTTDPCQTSQTGDAPVTSGKEQQNQPEKLERHSQPLSLTSRAWEILEGGAAEEDISKRTEAIAALGIVGPKKKAMALLETALRDNEPAVRQTAVAALGQIKSRRTVPKLRRMLDDEAPEVSFAAAQALWDMGDRSGRLILFEVLAGERNPSGGGLGRKVGEIKEKLHNPAELASFGIKQGARALLGPFAVGIAVAEELRKDQSAAARALSAALLGEDRSPESAEQLEQALDDKNWLVRSTAAKSLAKRRHRHALPRLAALLTDDKDVVRYSAAGAILALS